MAELYLATANLRFNGALRERFPSFEFDGWTSKVSAPNTRCKAYKRALIMERASGSVSEICVSPVISSLASISSSAAICDFIAAILSVYAKDRTLPITMELSNGYLQIHPHMSWGNWYVFKNGVDVSGEPYRTPYMKPWFGE